MAGIHYMILAAIYSLKESTIVVGSQSQSVDFGQLELEDIKHLIF